MSPILDSTSDRSIQLYTPHKMEMVKVDPKLFIMCRLCLDDLGMYQITPVVQSQIKYCFDIDVDPFDSLPQLICSKCESVLSDYVTVKRTFVGKQNALRARLEVRKGLEQSTQQGVVSSSSQEQDHNGPSRACKSKMVHQTEACASSAKEDVYSRSQSPISKKKKKLSKKGPKSRKQLWEDIFTKSFVCRLCNKSLANRGNLTRHVNNVHPKIMMHYKSLFIKSCIVRIEKVDGKPNFIDSPNVVLKPNKILSVDSSPLYHIIYSKPVSPEEEEENDDAHKTLKNKSSSESSDDEVLVKRPQSKRLRLLSKSSTDTVCLDIKDEDAKTDAPSGTEEIDTSAHMKGDEVCINIEDSSDSDHGSTMRAVDHSNRRDPKPRSITVGEYKAVQRIESSCLSKYVKRAELEIADNALTNSDVNINNKILNIGRKVIKPGVSLKGLMRFIDNKNLELEWHTMEESQSKENYVRVMPKIKDKKTDSEKQGWKFSNSEENEETDTEECPLYSESTEQVEDIITIGTNGPTFHVDDLLKEALEKENTDVQLSVNDEQMNDQGLVLYSVSSLEKENAGVELADRKTNSNRATLYPVPNNNEPDKILLNANPVINPKRLPKKTACPKSAKPKKDIEGCQTIVYDSVANPAIQIEAGLCMPIITSTTSLAPVSENNGDKMNPYNPVNSPTSEADTQSNADATPAPSNDYGGEHSSNSGPPPAINVPSLVTDGVESTKNNAPPSSDNAPRIKVKPVSELMSQQALNNLNLNNHSVVVPNNGWSVSGDASHVPYSLDTFQKPNLDAGSHISTPSSSTEPLNYVILDTIQFPNTKTCSPVKYVQDLLQVYNIILVDNNNCQNERFNSLIKFKVQIQDSVNHLPVVLYLSLHNWENQFHIVMRNPDGDGYIKVNSLSAMWQWEVLKMFTTREDVINKLLQSARKLGQAVYDYTNTFLCLVKSIKMGHT